MKKREIIELGDLDVDLEARQVRRGDEEIQLGRLSFELLEALIRAAPAALSTDEIVRTVWAGDIVSDETVKQRVSLLRRALGQGSGREYVETLRGYGYRLGIEIEGADAPEATIPTPDRGLGRVPRIIILTLVILSLLLLIVVLATAIRQVKRMSSLEGADPERCQPILVRAGSGDVGEGLAPSRGRPQGPPLHSR